MASRTVIFAASLLAATIGAGAVAAQAPDRSKPPVLGPAPVLKLPPIQKRALSNGLPVWFVGMHEVPLVDLVLVVQSGAAADPPGTFGVANFTAAMLDEGTTSRSALELADAVDFLGASLGTGSGFDSSTVTLHTPASKLDAALPLFADVVLRPAFPQADFDRVKQERLTSILQARDDASALASLAFPRLLFGATHRWGTATIGTEATNTAMTPAELRAFYATHYQPQNATLLVVGDVTVETMLPKLEQALGNWKNAGTVPRPALAVPAQTPTRRLYLIDKPGAAQSQIRMGWVGVARTTPDYFVIDVMNTMLGGAGSFSSRLNQNLREAHGYSYGASSSFSMRSVPGPFVAGAGVQTDKTVESLTEFFKEIDGMRQPVTAEDLTRVRNLEALSFPGDFETTGNVAQRLSELVVYNLPESFFAEYVPKIQAVTAADLGRATRQYLQSDKFAVVVVGDLSKIEQPIRNANFGEVRVVPLNEILK